MTHFRTSNSELKHKTFLSDSRQPEERKPYVPNIH